MRVISQSSCASALYPKTIYEARPASRASQGCPQQVGCITPCSTRAGHRRRQTRRRDGGAFKRHRRQKTIIRLGPGKRSAAQNREASRATHDPRRRPGGPWHSPEGRTRSPFGSDASTRQRARSSSACAPSRSSRQVPAAHRSARENVKDIRVAWTYYRTRPRCGWW